MIGVATLNSLDRSAEAAARRYILVPPKSLSVGRGKEETERRIGQISGLNYVFTLEDLDKLQVSNRGRARASMQDSEVPITPNLTTDADADGNLSHYSDLTCL